MKCLPMRLPVLKDGRPIAYRESFVKLSYTRALAGCLIESNLPR